MTARRLGIRGIGVAATSAHLSLGADDVTDFDTRPLRAGDAAAGPFDTYGCSKSRSQVNSS